MAPKGQGEKREKAVRDPAVKGNVGSCKKRTSKPQLCLFNAGLRGSDGGSMVQLTARGKGLRQGSSCVHTQGMLASVGMNGVTVRGSVLF